MLLLVVLSGYPRLRSLDVRSVCGARERHGVGLWDAARSGLAPWRRPPDDLRRLVESIAALSLAPISV